MDARKPTKRSTGLREELGPAILSRHLRALEAVAARLDQERPEADATFRGRLDQRVQKLTGDITPAGERGFLLRAAACAVSGMAMLAVAVIVAAGGGPAGS